MKTQYDIRYEAEELKMLRLIVEYYRESVGTARMAPNFEKFTREFLQQTEGALPQQ